MSSTRTRTSTSKSAKPPRASQPVLPLAVSVPQQRLDTAVDAILQVDPAALKHRLLQSKRAKQLAKTDLEAVRQGLNRP